MQQQTYIEFKKQRDLGAILTDTFAFLRNQFKPFFSTFFKLVGPYLFLLVISYSLYFYFVGDLANFNIERSNEVITPIMIFIVAILMLISIVLAYAMAQSTTLHYIRSYSNNKGTIDFDEIKKSVYATLGKYIGLSFLVVLTVIAGFIFCILPGIYFYVVLSLSYSILIFNQKSVNDAYQYSFTLIKNEWWSTFGNIIVIAIIVGIAGSALNLPAVIYMWAKMGIFSGEMDAESMAGGIVDPVYIFLNVLGTVIQFILQVITIVAVALIYFNLNERKNFTGTYEMIESLGKKDED
jgi:hypothetical protein